MSIARLTSCLPIIAVAAALAGCGSSGPSAAEVRCQNERQEAREDIREARAGITTAGETGNASDSDEAASNGLDAVRAQITDCR